jgi:hypothetical protein
VLSAAVRQLNEGLVPLNRKRYLNGLGIGS